MNGTATTPMLRILVRACLLLLTLALLLGGVEVRAATESIMVQPIRVSGVPASEGDAITSVVCPTLAGLGLFKVFCHEEIVAMLNAESQRQLVGCDNDSQCMAEIGNALGATYMLAGTLGASGGQQILKLSLLDTRRGDVLRRSVRAWLSFDDRDRAVEESLLDLFPSLAATRRMSMVRSVEFNECETALTCGNSDAGHRSDSADWIGVLNYIGHATDSEGHAPGTYQFDFDTREVPSAHLILPTDLSMVHRPPWLDISMFVEPDRPWREAIRRYLAIEEEVSRVSRQIASIDVVRSEKGSARIAGLKPKLNCRPLVHWRFALDQYDRNRVSDGELRGQFREAYFNAVSTLNSVQQKLDDLEREREVRLLQADRNRAAQELDAMLEQASRAVADHLAAGPDLADRADDLFLLGALELRRYVPPEMEDTGHYEGAAAYFLQVAEEYPEHPLSIDARYLSAIALYFSSSHEVEAAGRLEEIIARHPGSRYKGLAVRIAFQAFWDSDQQERAIDFVGRNREYILRNEGGILHVLVAHFFPSKGGTIDLALEWMRALAAFHAADPERSRLSFIREDFVNTAVSLLRWSGDTQVSEKVWKSLVDVLDADLLMDVGLKAADMSARDHDTDNALRYLEHLLANDPLGPAVPGIYRRMIEIYEFDRYDPDLAATFRLKMLTDTDPESPRCSWCMTQQNNPGALAAARETVIGSLAISASFLHIQARSLVQYFNNPNEAHRYLVRASEAYSELLKRFPEGGLDKAYYQFRLADVLYRIGNGESAAVIFHELARQPGFPLNEKAAWIAAHVYRELVIERLNDARSERRQLLTRQENGFVETVKLLREIDPEVTATFWSNPVKIEELRADAAGLLVHAGRCAEASPLLESAGVLAADPVLIERIRLLVSQCSGREE